jgi:hypothetical protein
MVEDQLASLLNIELALDWVRGARVERTKRRPEEQITLGALAAFMAAAGEPEQIAVARRSNDLATFWEHFKIS